MELIDYSGELLLNLIVNFPTRFPDYDSHISALLDLFISSESSILSVEAFPHLEIIIMLLSQFPLTFLQTQKGMPQLRTILVPIETVLMIICEVSYERISSWRSSP